MKGGTEKQLRVLIFNDPDVDRQGLIAKALLPFVCIKQVEWQYKPIPAHARYVFLKIPYRVMEGVYWVLRVFEEIHRFQADVLLVQYAYFCGLIGSLAARLSGKTLVIRAVGSDLRIYSQSPIGMLIVRLALKMASGAICVSKDLEKIAHRLGARNTVVIRPPLDHLNFDKMDFEKEDREIISVARLVPIKGMSYLIRAMTHMEDSTLVIVGDGPERRELELMACDLKLEDRIRFAGWVNDRSRLYGCLNHATIFVMPSLSEGLPRALIEAMACGLPVVATNVGGVPEIVVDGVNGFLVPPRDEKALAEAIEKALSDTDFQRTASAENREVAKKFLLPTIGQRTYEYLKEIAFN